MSKEPNPGPRPDAKPGIADRRDILLKLLRVEA